MSLWAALTCPHCEEFTLMQDLALVRVIVLSALKACKGSGFEKIAVCRSCGLEFHASKGLQFAQRRESWMK